MHYMINYLVPVCLCRDPPLPRV